MRRLLSVLALLCAVLSICEAARCTTTMDPSIRLDYEAYVRAAEKNMSARFELGELAWIPATAAKDAAAALAAGRSTRWNISDSALNQRIAGRNGTIIDWVGAIRIPRTKVAGIAPVLEDSSSFQRIYQPMVFLCRSKGRPEASKQGVVLGLQSVFRFLSVFPQHYAFQADAEIEKLSWLPGGTLTMRLRSKEIRESDSGVPGRNDFLEPYHDHGIMWALNAYWRARQSGPDVYLEFESITLARSVQAFSCKLGLLPVPKSTVAAAMDAIPSESVRVVLEGARTECARLAARRQVETEAQK
jgi:hypothetical protein